MTWTETYSPRLPDRQELLRKAGMWFTHLQWKTRDGRVYYADQMADEHVMNTLTWIEDHWVTYAQTHFNALTTATDDIGGGLQRSWHRNRSALPFYKGAAVVYIDNLLMLNSMGELAHEKAPCDAVFPEVYWEIRKEAYARGLLETPWRTPDATFP